MSGFTLVELLVGLALLGILAGAAASFFRATERSAVRHVEMVEGAEAVRIAASVLNAELRYLEPSSDLAAVAGDSIALRAFRGIAVVCADGPAEDASVVRYRGVREPEPAKDSVVIAGRPATLALAGSSAGGDACEAGADERVFRWTFSGPRPPPGAALLLFERGSYHVTGRAFRYRRGLGGRQPLTPERIDDAESGMLGVADDGAASGPADAAAVRIDLAIAAGDRRAGAARRPALRLRVAFVNAPADRPLPEPP